MILHISYLPISYHFSISPSIRSRNTLYFLPTIHFLHTPSLIFPQSFQYCQYGWIFIGNNWITINNQNTPTSCFECSLRHLFNMANVIVSLNIFIKISTRLLFTCYGNEAVYYGRTAHTKRLEAGDTKKLSKVMLKYSMPKF